MVSAALAARPQLEPQPTLAPVPRRTEISLRDVSVAYPCERGESKTVLSGIDLEIAAGEFVVVLGETGCGKSTLLRLVLGEESPTFGSVQVDGKPVTCVDSRCGYVPQKYSLFPDRTVMGNVMYGPENAQSGLLGRWRPSFRRYRRNLSDKARGSLERMGLRAQDFSKYPHQLSGGMQQRVAIAQALLMRPPVLLMDEAFSALDPSTRSRLQEQLHAIWFESRPTILFVTHNTQEALLLGTRLLLLGRYSEESRRNGNILLDMENPLARLPFARRAQSPELHRIQDQVRQAAFAASSMGGAEDPVEFASPESLSQ